MSKGLSCLIVLWLSACAGASPAPDAALAAVQNGAAAIRPVPPADLDVRLIQYYPLRGHVLRESGFARVSFTVAVNGTVTAASEALEANHPVYAAACRRMLEASAWTPARDASDRAVPYTGTFDCAFQHDGALSTRATLEVAATPPEMPDLSGWYRRNGGEEISENTGAVLQIAVQPDGRVDVLGMQNGSNAHVAEVCSRALEEGPLWGPALDKQGRPVRYEMSFTCRVNLEAPDKRLELVDVGASGVLDVKAVATEVAEHLPAFTHCFESAFGMSKKVHGKHWLAFEVSAAGAVGRTEWVERPLADEMLETCVFSALQALRFPPAAAGTLVDVQLEAGGVARIRPSL
jgi:hypothetical protein